MTFSEKFDRFERNFIKSVERKSQLEAELQREIERLQRVDELMALFDDADEVPVADEPVIVTPTVPDDQPEIISEPVKDEPVIVAPMVVADEPVIVPPAPAPSADSDLGAMLAAIQRAGLKVGNDFKPVVVADNPETVKADDPIVETVKDIDPKPLVAERVKVDAQNGDEKPFAIVFWPDQVFLAYQSDQQPISADIIARKLDCNWSNGELVTVKERSLLHWLLSRSEESGGRAKSIDLPEKIICAALSKKCDNWLSVSEILSIMEEMGYWLVRSTIYNLIADNRSSLIKHHENFIEQRRDGKKRMFRLIADIDPTVKDWQ